MVVAAFAAKGLRIAYPLTLVLAVLTLAVSLPQPAHYSFVEAGPSLASATFVVGSALQLALLVLVPVYLYHTKSTKS